MAKKRLVRKKATMDTPKSEELIDQIHPLIEKRLTVLDTASAEHYSEIMRLVDRVSVLTPGNVTKRKLISGRTARNLCAFTGLSCIGYGCWIISPICTYIVIGSILLVGSIVGMVAQLNGTEKDS